MVNVCSERFSPELSHSYQEQPWTRYAEGRDKYVYNVTRKAQYRGLRWISFREAALSLVTIPKQSHILHLRGCQNQQTCLPLIDYSTLSLRRRSPPFFMSTTFSSSPTNFSERPSTSARESSPAHLRMKPPMSCSASSEFLVKAWSSLSNNFSPRSPFEPYMLYSFSEREGANVRSPVP
jgi:hypothetical protein